MLVVCHQGMDVRYRPSIQLTPECKTVMTVFAKKMSGGRNGEGIGGLMWRCFKLLVCLLYPTYALYGS